ncbi:MAG TPA: DUF6627 family protein [Gammaproteobacteria bacterium]|nr:DUF6627 family protein [Gammaproteobacteria bacterium]
MSSPDKTRRLAGTVLAALMLTVQAAVPLHAAPVGTGAVLAAEQGRVDRQHLRDLLEREDVARQLQAMGVDPERAKDRVANLSPAEIARLNQRIDELPAGGISALGALALIFLVFIITDAVGATDFFTFVEPAN